MFTTSTPGTLVAPGAALSPRRSLLKRLGAALGVGLLAPAAPVAAAPARSPLGVQSGQPFVGDIILVAFNFAPYGWMPCDGRLLSIAEHEVLFQLIGTTYGGNGQDNFALPDLRSRIPVGMGSGPNGALQNVQMGEPGGAETNTLLASQLPVHRHPAAEVAATATTLGDRNTHATASGRDGAGTPLRQTNLYAAGATANLSNTQPAGGSQPLENRPPLLGLSYLISLYGVFPSQT